MFTRRETILGGALTILWSVRHAHAHETLGCVINEDEARAYIGTPSSYDLANRYISRSGDTDFDYALAQMLGKMSDAFGVLPSFGYYDDFDGRNAYASSVRLVTQADGTVLFGKRLFLGIMGSNDNPDVAVTAVCAHEFGHIVQFKHGISNSDLGDEPGRVKHKELHADFLSGYFAGMRKLQKPDYPAAVYAVTLESLGDFNFTNPTHHGTPAERVKAMIAGYEVGHAGKSVAEAVEAGAQFVRTM